MEGRVERCLLLVKIFTKYHNVRYCIIICGWVGGWVDMHI